MGFNIQNHKELTQVTTLQDTSLGIMKWGQDNSFPQTLKNLIEQSPSAKPAVARTAKFLKGEEFKGQDTIVNPRGLTLKKLVGIMADDYAMFDAFALQCNYNLEGKIVSVNPMRITDLRFNQFDELGYASKIGYHENFGRNSEIQRIIDNTVTRGKINWIDRFNPEVVDAQIKDTEGGISNYKGQILYHSDAGDSSYPIPKLQAPVNFVLADVENSILARKETSTGFISTYLLKTMMNSELEASIESAQGARGTGKVITMSNMSQEAMSSTVLEEIGSGASGAGAIIDSVQKAYELCSKVINGVYMIPPVLAGENNGNAFAAPDLKDAYYIFNANTKNGRETIESELNRILKNSVFKTKEIKLEELALADDEALLTERNPPRGKDKKKRKPIRGARTVDGKPTRGAIKIDKKNNDKKE